MSRMTAARGMLLAVAALVFGLLGFTVSNYVGVVDVRASASTPVVEVPPAPQRECLVDLPPTNLANVVVSAKERQWSFGPPSTRRSNYHAPFVAITTMPDLDATASELKARLCGAKDGRPEDWHGGDDALYLAIMSVIDGQDPNRTITREEWQNGVQYLVQMGLQYRRASIEPRSEDGSGYTLYMEPNQAGRPRIGASKLRPVASWYYIIPVVMPDDVEYLLELRMDCGYQPRFSSRAQLPKALQGQV